MMRSWDFAAALKPLGLIGLVAWSTGAVAEVVLDTAVSKVETTLDAGGRVKRELIPVDDVMPGEELRYSITFTNDSQIPVDADRIVITNPIPEGTRYVAGSAGGDGALVEYSSDGETFVSTEPAAGTAAGSVPAAGAQGATGAGSGAATGAAASSGGVRSLRWTYQRTLAPGDSGEVFFHVRMQ